MESKEVVDYIALVVPLGVTLDQPGVLDKLDAMTVEAVVKQYADRKAPAGILLAPVEWTLTSDPEMVTTVQPEHDCETCRDGNLKAQEFLREHPDRQIALGNVHYLELW